MQQEKIFSSRVLEFFPISLKRRSVNNNTKLTAAILSKAPPVRSSAAGEQFKSFLAGAIYL
jgi:hypothetical protein